MSFGSENWVVKMLEMASQGYHETEIRKELGVSKKQWETYVNRSPEFQELVEHCRDLSESWHYSESRKMVTGKEYSAVNLNALSKRMENLYGWSTKVDNKTTTSLTVDARQQLEERLPEIITLIGEEKARLILEHKPE